MMWKLQEMLPKSGNILFKLTLLLIFSSDVLNVSGRFNSEELSRDMTVGDDVKDEPFFEEGKKHSSAECFSSYWKNGLFNLRCEEPWKGKISDLDPSP